MNTFHLLTLYFAITVRILFTEQLKHDCAYTGKLAVTVHCMIGTDRHGMVGTLQVDGMAYKKCLLQLSSLCSRKGLSLNFGQKKCGKSCLLAFLFIYEKSNTFQSLLNIHFRAFGGEILLFLQPTVPMTS